jgi:hypothetical protein
MKSFSYIQKIAINGMLIPAILFVIIFSLIPFSFSESNIPNCDTENTLDIVTDRVHYAVGDTILLSGCLSEDIKNEDIHLSATGSVGENAETKMFLSTIIKANPDGTFNYKIPTENLSLKYGLWISVVAGLHEEAVQVKFSKLGQLCASVSNENPIIVFTDKENYEREDKISVYGCLAEVAYTKGIDVSVYDQSGNVVAGDLIIPEPDFTFETEFEIDDSFAADGIYTVEADAAGLYASSKTIVVPEVGSTIMIVLIIGFVSVALVTSKRFLSSFH